MEKLYLKKQIIMEKILNDKNIEDLKELIKECNDIDNTNLMFYRDGKEDKISKLLFYEREKLIGYFGFVNSYKDGEARVWGTIHPDYRKESISNEIFKNVKEYLKDINIKTLSIINEREASSIGDLIVFMGGRKKYSTYQMEFKEEYYKGSIKLLTEVTLNKSTIEDLEDIIPIGMEAFGTSEEEERSYNQTNLKDPKCILFTGNFKNNIVGIISVRISNGKGSIADLAVLKSYRGRGIGRTILTKTITYLLNQGIERFTLSVKTENESALSLYEGSGFRIVKVHDCYELKM